MSSINPTALSGRRILVVEDEFFIADDIGQALTQLGAEVVGPVPTLNQALQALDDGASVDAAVLDVNLRNEPSFPIADVLLDRGVPFVFATGYSPTAIPPSYKHISHWVKPFDPKELVSALPGLLQAKPR